MSYESIDLTKYVDILFYSCLFLGCLDFVISSIRYLIGNRKAMIPPIRLGLFIIGLIKGSKEMEQRREKLINQRYFKALIIYILIVGIYGCVEFINILIRLLKP